MAQLSTDIGVELYEWLSGGGVLYCSRYEGFIQNNYEPQEGPMSRRHSKLLLSKRNENY